MLFNFRFLNYTSCVKHTVSVYGIQEFNAIDMNEVTVYDYFLVSFRDVIWDIWYYDRFHMLNLVEECFS